MSVHAPPTSADLARALEMARAACHEAMGRAGMLRGKVDEVHTYAETLLSSLDQEDDADGVGS
ncbi:hypothetical protein [Actinomadura flavalba]|uniref:hypothetical protein n=1 Tax=Actinomadura flavalba TaxID=1120938 RepID=UPI0003A3DFD2|nr:hypothetical protein [Actinomadura flavalba]